MTNDYGAARLREAAIRRLRAALDAVETCGVWERPAVARWVSAAPARQNRRRMLRAVLAAEAARAENGRSLAACGIGPAHLKKWRAAVLAEHNRVPAFAAACEAAVQTLRRAISPPRDITQKEPRP